MKKKRFDADCFWNYRIVRHRHQRRTWYGLHEVYYKKGGKIEMWADAEVVGDDVADIIGALALMLRDATRRDRPILDERDLPGWKNGKHVSSTNQ